MKINTIRNKKRIVYIQLIDLYYMADIFKSYLTQNIELCLFMNNQINGFDPFDEPDKAKKHKKELYTFLMFDNPIDIAAINQVPFIFEYEDVKNWSMHTILRRYHESLKKEHSISSKILNNKYSSKDITLVNTLFFELGVQGYFSSLYENLLLLKTNKTSLNLPVGTYNNYGVIILPLSKK